MTPSLPNYGSRICVDDFDVTITFPKSRIKDSQRVLNRKLREKGLGIKVYRKNGEWRVLSSSKRWDFTANSSTISIPKVEVKDE